MMMHFVPPNVDFYRDLAKQKLYQNKSLASTDCCIRSLCLFSTSPKDVIIVGKMTFFLGVA